LEEVSPSNQHLTTINHYLYCGEQYDSDLGMYFLRARYMEPDRGRFWTMDSYEGRGHDPVTLHKYLYANADPVNGIDPSGNMTLVEVTGVSTVLSIGSALAIPAFRDSIIDVYTALILAHWNRNRFNLPPLTEGEAIAMGWTRLGLKKSVFHGQGNGLLNSKYISPNGLHEAVYDKDGNLDRSALNRGTYNFAHPVDEPLGHVLKDVLPYYLLGNDYNDPSTFRDRIRLSVESFFIKGTQL